MCQSLNTSYQFCGCTGATYEQRCSEPSPTWELLLARLTPVKLQCYCPKHSSQTFKSRVEGKHERERKRIDSGIPQILVWETPDRWKKNKQHCGGKKRSTLSSM